MRTSFDALVARQSLPLQIAAEVDDMAMMRLLARDGVGVAVLPPIVVKDEISAGTLVAVKFLFTICIANYTHWTRATAHFYP